MAQANVRSIELLVIQDTKSSSDYGSGVKLRVVQWVYSFNFQQGMERKGYHRAKDGKAFSVKLEKRSYYTQNNQVKTGKAEGFLLSDLAYLHPKWKDIIKIMKEPPDPAPLPTAAKPDDDIPEEVPF